MEISDRSAADEIKLNEICKRMQEQSEFIEIYHCHLPVLDENGIIHWDRETDIVESGPYFEDAVSVLEQFVYQEEG
ncbi:DUF7344 domain-containing protein [Natranaeroarchaeum sulfidigenes]|nr:hypothetical protein [Natranaeroarchaeum sulfidigenes]